jgi:glycerol uptake facilitator-like aquaporin
MAQTGLTFTNQTDMKTIINAFADDYVSGILFFLCIVGFVYYLTQRSPEIAFPLLLFAMYIFASMLRVYRLKESNKELFYENLKLKKK